MTETPWIGRPEVGEFLPYFGRYIDLVPEGDLLVILRRQVDEVVAALDAIEPEVARARPAVGEWSPLDIAVHLSDTERVLAFRAFTFARLAGPELPGVDFERMAEAADANRRSIEDVTNELRTVRAATIALLGSLRPGELRHRGIASDAEVTVRALAYIVAGHDLHHLLDLRAAASRR